MSNFVDKRGNILCIDRPSGPHKGFDATIQINSDLPFHLTEKHCREIRQLLERLLDWDNSRRPKP
jgi:hypothetical protein